MKFTIPSKTKVSVSAKASSTKVASPTKDDVKAALKEGIKRRSEKEIGLIILLDKLNEIDKDLSAGQFAELCRVAADGRKIKDTHVEKIARVIRGRIERFKTPITKLLTSRNLI